VESKYDRYREVLDTVLIPEGSFDLIKKTMYFKLGEASFYYIDGFVKDVVMQKLMEYLLKATSPGEITDNIPYVEVEKTSDTDVMIKMVLSGATVLIIDGFEEAIILDTREYPVRAISEPENDRVLRGPRDGFTETLIFNTALIRRRVRDPNLRMEIFTVGDLTQTDVVLCHIAGRSDEKFVSKLREKLKNLKIGALNLGHQSLSELLCGKTAWNPFPRVRYSERPDSASAMLMEGSVLLLCDNYPAAMILPTSIFDFLQETDDFYFPPLVGSYLKLLRLAVFLMTIFFSPIWFLLASNPHWLSEGLAFLAVGENNCTVPLFWQLILVELVIDGLKLASLNTPSSLAGSLSVVAGLILGEYAVEVGWLVPEVILYMAFVGIANFTQPSYEMGYAFKFMRLLMLIGVEVAGLWGLMAGFVIMVILIATNKTVDGSRGYLYPFIPWNSRAIKRLFLRVKLK